MPRTLNEHLEHLATLGDGDEATRYYDTECFPLALARLRTLGRPSDVLVATVGTQPYSVALSLAHTPATHVILVHTDETAAMARKAVAWARLTEEPTYRVVGRADSVGVYETIRGVVESMPGRGITIDFTSGTKAMTAAASTVAGHLRLRQVYIESRRVHPRFALFGHEAAHEMEHPLVVLGDGPRAEAERAFDRGMFDVAGRIFADLESAMVPHYHFRARRRLCQAYAAWDGLRFADAAERLRQVSHDLEAAQRHALAREPLLAQAGRLAAQAEAADRLVRATGQTRASDADLTHALTRYLVACARRRLDREADLAALLYYRALELSLQRRLAVHGLDPSDVAGTAPVDDLLARYNAACDRPEFRLEALPKAIARYQSRTMLEALDDAVIRGLAIPRARFEGVLESRNRSIFAHGFLPIATARVQPFADVVMEVVRRVAAADRLPIPERDPVYEPIRLQPTPARGA